MSNFVPPLLSNTPPPIMSPVNGEEDEFGDFRTAGDSSFDYGDDVASPTSNHTEAYVADHRDSDCDDFNRICNNHSKSHDMSDVSQDFEHCKQSEKNIQSTITSTADRMRIDDCINPNDNNNVVTVNGPMHSDGIYAPFTADCLSKNIQSMEYCLDSNVKTPLVWNSISQKTSFEQVNNNQLDVDNTQFLQNVQSITISNSNQLLSDKESQCKNNDSEDDDFGDFIDSRKTATTISIFTNDSFIKANVSTTQSSTNTVVEESTITSFADFSKLGLAPIKGQQILENDDGFSAFKDYSVQTPLENCDCFTDNLKTCCDQAKLVFRHSHMDGFNLDHNWEDDDEHFIERCIENDVIFNQLKDITDTPAVHFKWAQSDSKQLLLKALTIQIEDVLPVPEWIQRLQNTIETHNMNSHKDYSSSLKCSSVSNATEQFLDSTTLIQPKKSDIYSTSHEVKRLNEQQTTSAPTVTDLQVKLLPYDFTLKTTHVTLTPASSSQNGKEEPFIDFYSSPPNAAMIADILQPVPVAPLITSNVNTILKPAIEWPDPGVTDDDEHIKHIEMTYSKCTTDVVAEDDEWSEYASRSAVKSEKSSPLEQSRTATPDLPLSVLNLSQVQPLKMPNYPIVTPSGMMMNSNVVAHSKSTRSPKILSPQKSRPLVNTDSTLTHPSLISEQYEYHRQQLSPIRSLDTITSNTILNLKDDNDEEWSEFVSGRSPLQMMNNTHNVPFKINTNIIMNPTYQTCVPFTAAAAATSSMTTSTTGRNTIFSLPDLDFAGWRSNSKGRKKAK